MLSVSLTPTDQVAYGLSNIDGGVQLREAFKVRIDQVPKGTIVQRNREADGVNLFRGERKSICI